jgi:hypothetical protein
MMIDGSSEDTNEVLIGMGGWKLPPFSRVFYPAKPEKATRAMRSTDPKNHPNQKITCPK